MNEAIHVARQFIQHSGLARGIMSWIRSKKEAKKNDNSGIRTHALDGPAPEAGALDHSATLSSLIAFAPPAT